MSAIYTAVVTSTGGRNGRILSDDGVLDMPVAVPKAMGGSGLAANPEQLFAGGYAACFGNAVLHIARRRGEALNDADVTVEAQVGVSGNPADGFRLTAALDVTLAGVGDDAAAQIVAAAHLACPYSNAIRNNVDVRIRVNGR